MSGKMITPIYSVEKMILEATQRREKAIVNAYCYVGEHCVSIARNGGNYTDRTGNLRSSIGYVVLHNGKVIQKGSNEQVKKGEQGVKEGNQFLQELISKSEYRKGIVLIVLAGMNYAASVEAKGFDVLTSSELQATKLAAQMMSQLGFKVL